MELMVFYKLKLTHTQLPVTYLFISRQEYEVLVVSVATLVGAWVGAFPILLDWNKPWQVYS